MSMSQGLQETIGGPHGETRCLDVSGLRISRWKQYDVTAGSVSNIAHLAEDCICMHHQTHACTGVFSFAGHQIMLCSC